MSALVALVIVIAGAAGAIVRALLIDQVRGQIQHHLTQSVESTIASLPDDLQAEWGEEWRAELTACIAMPVTATRFARGLRARAHGLVDDPARAPQAQVRSVLVARTVRRLRALSRLMVDRAFPVAVAVSCAYGSFISARGGIVSAAVLLGLGAAYIGGITINDYRRGRI